MPQRLISRSPDLKRLRDEGYEIGIRDGFLLISHVPYVTRDREVAHGVVVSTLSLAGDVTTTPADHVVFFIGSVPCDRGGQPLTRILHSSSESTLAPGLVINHTFSSKPPAGYPNYYDKITTYLRILTAEAQALDPDASATPFLPIADTEEDAIFNYIDSASSRAGIGAISAKLQLGKVAIVGLGGTGAYILDLVAKTPVREIHLFDNDVFIQHNAFRSPGAASVEELRKKLAKVDYFAARYAPMHRGIVPHAYRIDPSNVAQLLDMDFVFVSLDKGPVRRLLVATLQAADVPFIDAGMGVYEVDGSLAGVARVTLSSSKQKNHIDLKGRIPFADGDGNDDYSRNIQIADLNALNAALAVIRWKKLFGFYVDLEREHYSAYTVDGNHLLNEDKVCRE